MSLEETEDDLIMTDFMNRCGFDTFGDLLTEIPQYKIKNICTLNKTKLEQIKTI